MALVNFVTFAVLKILDNHFPSKALSMQISADLSQISKTVPRELTFILNVLSQSSIQVFLLQSSVFEVHFSNDFGMRTRHFQKVVHRMNLFLFL